MVTIFTFIFCKIIHWGTFAFKKLEGKWNIQAGIGWSKGQWSISFNLKSTLDVWPMKAKELCYNAEECHFLPNVMEDAFPFSLGIYPCRALKGEITRRSSLTMPIMWDTHTFLYTDTYICSLISTWNALWVGWILDGSDLSRVLGARRLSVIWDRMGPYPCYRMICHRPIHLSCFT